MNPNMVDNSNMYATEDDLNDLCIINYDQLNKWVVRRPAPKPPRSQDLLLTNEALLETIVDFNVNGSQELAAPIPEHWNKFPNMENVDTDYSFDMHIDPGENQNWLFNPKIGKVYIKLNSVMKVTVSYKPHTPTNLFLRAMILYASPDDMHLQVKRCANHRVINDNQAMPPEHILRCCHPNTQYVGNENAQLFGQRLSVLVPLDRPATNEDGFASESIVLEFMCQNSCTTGINRKSTAVVFTLENDRNEIIGKRVMPFKVCSCPKRDMQKEDTSFMPVKRKSSAGSYGKRPTKKMCLPEMKNESPASSPSPTPSQFLEPTSTEVTVTLTMPTKDSMLHVLRCAHNEVTGLMTNSTGGHSREFITYAQRIEGLLVAHS